MSDDDSGSPTDEKFEKICSSVVENVQTDRKALKDIVAKMEQRSESMPELMPLFLDVTVKAYEALNRMNAHLVSVAGLYKKKKESSSDSKGEDDYYNAIGDVFANDGNGSH